LPSACGRSFLRNRSDGEISLTFVFWEKPDYEAKFAVVIGPKAIEVTEAEAPICVFGYLVADDVSARDWQYYSSSPPTSCPPWRSLPPSPSGCERV
jgi:2-keto-4-pentenoate hydratase/2-oxohepta-3-ene-1,7-dioic acid hydratase in catechol pathway